MKLKFFAVLALSLCMAKAAYANTIVTAPLDSRPISTDYLSNLAAVGGDKVEYADKDNLDYFSAYEENNRLANSAAVRAEIANMTAAHDTAGTTVIINTSSYITNGLVGSRCGKNYADCDKALADLKSLVYGNRNPVYYINIQMPRTLPETRFNTIWPNDNKVKGLGWYYLNSHKDYANYTEFANTYSEVTPSQLLLEYGYVESKKNELGVESLSSWEKSFLNDFKKNYYSKGEYKKCIDDYKLPFDKTKDIFAYALALQQEGRISDIVVSNDDIQLPNSVVYLYSNGGNEENWIQSESGAAVKFSFARGALLKDRDSISTKIIDAYGNDEKVKSFRGESKRVNVIYGTDEIPQLIYARSLAKRKNLTAKFEDTKWNELQSDVATYDVKNPHVIMSTAVNFASGGLSVNYATDKSTRIYVYDYSRKFNYKDFISKMNTDYKKGINVALIELYTSTNSNNTVLKTMLAAKPSALQMNAAQLSAYSAWNTNGNAIGLGVAHAQTYAIAQQSRPGSDLVKSQAVMLGQHIYEDGVYTADAKKQLANKGLKPQGEDLTNSTMLYSMLNTDTVNNAFLTADYKLGDKVYKLKKFDIATCNFPWGRTFDCYIDINAEVAK